jgi:hypothetical protein
MIETIGEIWHGVWELDGGDISLLISPFHGYMVVIQENVLTFRKYALIYQKPKGISSGKLLSNDMGTKSSIYVPVDFL